MRNLAVRRLGLFVIFLFGAQTPNSASAQSLEPSSWTATSSGLSLGQTVSLSILGPGALWANPANIGASDEENNQHENEIAPARHDLPGNFLVGFKLQKQSRSFYRVSPIVNESLPEARDLSGASFSPHLAISQSLWRNFLWLGAAYQFNQLLSSDYAPIEADTGGRIDPGRYLGTALQSDEHEFNLGLTFQMRYFALGTALELALVDFSYSRTLWSGLPSERDKIEDPRLDAQARLQFERQLVTRPRLGVALHPLPWLSLGALARLPSENSFNGPAQLTARTQTPSGFDSASAQSGQAALTYQFPLEIQGGLRLKFRRWVIFGEGSFTRWSVNDNLAATLTQASLNLTNNGATETVVLDNLPLSLHLRDQYGLHAGAYWQVIPSFLRLLAGYCFVRGATQADGPTPLLLDFNRHMLSGGLSVTAWRVTATVGVRHSLQASLDSAGENTNLLAPLDPGLLRRTGNGSYQTSLTTAAFDLTATW